MEFPSKSLRALAQRLLALEAAANSAAQPPVHEAVRVFDKLRVSLTRFAGADGFTSLLRRSLTMARGDVPALRDVQIGQDGSLQGLETIAALPEAGEAEMVRAAIAVAAHLLGLLVTFVGEPMTLRLLRDAWPEATFENGN